MNAKESLNQLQVHITPLHQAVVHHPLLDASRPLKDWPVSWSIMSLRCGIS